MIDGSEKRNCQLAFELQNLHVCEKCSKNNNTLTDSYYLNSTYRAAMYSCIPYPQIVKKLVKASRYDPF